MRSSFIIIPLLLITLCCVGSLPAEPAEITFIALTPGNLADATDTKDIASWNTSPSSAAVLRSWARAGSSTLEPPNPNLGDATRWIPIIFAWEKPIFPDGETDLDYFFIFGLRPETDSISGFNAMPGYVRGETEYKSIRCTVFDRELNKEPECEILNTVAPPRPGTNDEFYWIVLPADNDEANNSEDLGLAPFVESGFDRYMDIDSLMHPAVWAKAGLVGGTQNPSGLYEWSVVAVSLVSGEPAIFSSTPTVLIDNRPPEVKNFAFRWYAPAAGATKEINWSVGCEVNDATRRRNQRAFSRDAHHYLAWSNSIPRELAVRIWDDVDVDEAETVSAGNTDLQWEGNSVKGVVLLPTDLDDSMKQDNGPGKRDEIRLFESELSSGSYTLQIEPHDAAVAIGDGTAFSASGNIGATAGFSFIVDNVAPDATLTVTNLSGPCGNASIVGGSAVGGTAVITLTVSDPALSTEHDGSGIDWGVIVVDASQLNPAMGSLRPANSINPPGELDYCTSELTLTWEVDVTATTGRRVVTASWIRDAVRNEKQTPTQAEIWVDSSPPNATLTVANPNPLCGDSTVIGGSTAEITLTVSDPGDSGIDWTGIVVDASKLNSATGYESLTPENSINPPGEIPDCRSELTLTWEVPVTAETGRWLVTASGIRDTVGNEKTTPTQGAIWVDNVPPLAWCSVVNSATDLPCPEITAGIVGGSTAEGTARITLTVRDPMLGAQQKGSGIDWSDIEVNASELNSATGYERLTPADSINPPGGVDCTSPLTLIWEVPVTAETGRWFVTASGIRDAVGNEKTTPTQGAIWVDNVPPRVWFSVVNSATDLPFPETMTGIVGGTTAGGTAEITLTMRDPMLGAQQQGSRIDWAGIVVDASQLNPVAGLNGMLTPAHRIYPSVVDSCTSTLTFIWEVEVTTGSGEKTVIAGGVYDGVGNPGPAVSDSIVVDASPPSAPQSRWIDLFELSSEWLDTETGKEGLAGDINRDNSVDTQDLLDLIRRWRH